MMNINKCSLIKNFDYFLNQKSSSIFNNMIISIVFNVIHFSKPNEEKNVTLGDPDIAVITKEIEEIYYELYTINMDRINMFEVVSSVLFVSNSSPNYEETKLNINSNHELGDLKIFDFSEYNSISKNIYVHEKTLSRLNYIANKLFIVLVNNISKSNIELSLLKNRLKMILFSTVVFSIIFNKNKNIKLCYFLNPFHPVEAGMFLAAKLSSLTTWFIPHGLPQKSFYINTYDIVTPLTLRDQSWYSFHPKKFIYLPWSESKNISKKYSERRISKKINLLFFSQLSGAELHGVEGLELVAKRFIFLLSQNKYINQIKIRFRNRKEKDLYFGNSEELSFIQYSIATEQNIQKDLDEADCLASCSSTALLYAQACNIPSIHVYDKTIIDVWPYRLSSPERSIEIKYIEEDMNLVTDAVDSIMDSRHNNKLLYLENTNFNLEEILEKGI